MTSWDTTKWAKPGKGPVAHMNEWMRDTEWQRSCLRRVLNNMALTLAPPDNFKQLAADVIKRQIEQRSDGLSIYGLRECHCRGFDVQPSPNLTKLVLMDANAVDVCRVGPLVSTSIHFQDLNIPVEYFMAGKIIYPADHYLCRVHYNSSAELTPWMAKVFAVKTNIESIIDWLMHYKVSPIERDKYRRWIGNEYVKHTGTDITYIAYHELLLKHVLPDSIVGVEYLPSIAGYLRDHIPWAILQRCRTYLSMIAVAQAWEKKPQPYQVVELA